MSTYSSPSDVVAGTLARASSLNTVDAAVATAFALLPTNANINHGTINFATDTGAVDAYVVTAPHTPSGYVDGLLIVMLPINTNTGACTINVSSLGVKSIKLADSTNPGAADIRVGVPIELRYSTVTGFFHINVSNITFTGSVGVANGGTGATTLAAGGIICGNGTGIVSVVSPGATTEILVGGGAATVPVWTTATGSGAPVRATSPSLVTPALGAATATSINGLTITSSTGTLTIAAGKVATVSNTLTLTATDGSTLAIGTGGTLGTAAYTATGAYEAAGGIATHAAVTATHGATGAVAGTTNTQTFTNKRITRRTGSTTSSATPTINTDNVDYYELTAQAADITSFTTNLSGTPTKAQTLWIAITDNGSPRAITWGASFEASSVSLPTTTVTSTRLDVGFIFNDVTSKWRCVAKA